MSTIIQQAAVLISPAKILWFPEAATQTFKKGEFVYLVSGKVTVVPTTKQSQSKVAGMALMDASETVDTAIAIAVAEEGVVFELNVYHSSVGSAITAVADVSKVYGLKIASNKHYVDLTDTADTVFHVKRLSPKDASGDTYGRLQVEVIGSRCQLSGQTS